MTNTEQNVIPSLYKLMQFRYAELSIYKLPSKVFSVYFNKTFVSSNGGWFFVSGTGKTLYGLLQ